MIKTKPEIILEYLYTSGQPPPDLIIRSGMGENELPRTSGFLPLQSTYSCWSFIPTNFPDIEPGELLESVRNFLGYKRRRGR